VAWDGEFGANALSDLGCADGTYEAVVREVVGGARSPLWS
jgi:hypothetical protein